MRSLADAIDQEPHRAKFRAGGIFDLAFPEGLPVPSVVTVLGAPGAGKTTELLRALAQTAMRAPGSALLIGAESGAAIVAELAARAGLTRRDLERIDVAFLRTPGAAVDAAIDSSARLVVYDSASMLAQDSGRTSGQVARMIAQAVARRPHVAMIVLHRNARGAASGGPSATYRVDAEVTMLRDALLVTKARFAHVERVPRPRWSTMGDENEALTKRPRGVTS